MCTIFPKINEKAHIHETVINLKNVDKNDLKYVLIGIKKHVGIETG